LLTLIALVLIELQSVIFSIFELLSSAGAWIRLHLLFSDLF